MTTPYFFTFHIYWHLSNLCSFLNLALMFSSGGVKLSRELDPINAAFLTNKAAASSIELFALEALQATSPKPRPEKDIENIIKNFGGRAKHIKITPHIELNDEAKDGLMVRFYDQNNELYDCITTSNPGEFCVFGEKYWDERRAA